MAQRSIIHRPVLPSFVVPRETAMRDPTRHQFIAGLGHVAHEGVPEVPLGAALSPPDRAHPPAGAADGSRHLLNPPNGGKSIAFEWLAVHQAWKSERPEAGNRLAWPATFLSRAGWTYKGAAPAILRPDAA
jgi:hypothetical protein